MTEYNFPLNFLVIVFFTWFTNFSQFIFEKRDLVVSASLRPLLVARGLTSSRFIIVLHAVHRYFLDEKTECVTFNIEHSEV